MDELIDITTKNGEPTGKTALKSAAHKNGWFHATVHVWLYTKDEKVLLQQRSFTKKVFPGIWDISVAGHIAAGEVVIEAAKREVFEEIGLSLNSDDFKKITTRIHQVKHDNGIQDNEFHHVFIAELSESISSLKIQPEEVEDIKLFELSTLKNTKNLENVLLPRFHDYYALVHDKILEELNS